MREGGVSEKKEFLKQGWGLDRMAQGPFVFLER